MSILIVLKFIRHLRQDLQDLGTKKAAVTNIEERKAKGGATSERRHEGTTLTGVERLSICDAKRVVKLVVSVSG